MFKIGRATNVQEMDGKVKPDVCEQGGNKELLGLLEQETWD